MLTSFDVFTLLLVLGSRVDVSLVWFTNRIPRICFTPSISLYSKLDVLKQYVARYYEGLNARLCAPEDLNLWNVS